MALSIEQISARVASLRYRAVDRDTRAQNVLAVRKGDIASVYPDFFPEGVDANVVANFVDIVARDLSEVMAPLPAVNCSAANAVKDRIVMAANNKIYEFSTTASSAPTAVYTHSDENHTFTSITASGTAIYVAGFIGVQSSIYKFTLNSTGTMPSLTSAITAAEMPAGELIHSIKYYLGYMLIGTSKGIRAATVDNNGSITYGPLIVETSQPVYDFAFKDRFAWAATGVDGEAGVIRIDLGNDLGGLRFAYANDLWLDNSITGYKTTACAFAGLTDRLVFVTDAINRGTITNKELTSNVATLTTSTAHNLTTGDSIWVEGVDSTFNGNYIVTAATTTTFSYAISIYCCIKCTMR